MDSPVRTLAHISDLHVGRNKRTNAAAEHIAAKLADARIDTVLLTGDVTHRGRIEEYEDFLRIFAPLNGRLVVVPGNHDHLGDSVATAIMDKRVDAVSKPGLHIVRLDSTAPHNRWLINGHGQITNEDLEQVEAALRQVPERALRIVMLHHHVLPLPVEDLPERIVNFLGHPCADELPLGEDLLERLVGKCDLVLHGHRHVPAEFKVEGDELMIANAGSTTGLMKCRLFAHMDGRVLWEAWLAFEKVKSRLWSPAAALIEKLA